MAVTKENVWDGFTSMINIMVENNSFQFPCAHWLNPMKGEIVAAVIDLPLNEVGGVGYQIVNTTTNELECEYLCFAMDMSSRPDQGLEFDDFVLVGEYDQSRAPSGSKTYKDRWRWGVINYRRDPDLVIRDVDWDNPFWGNVGKGGMRLLNSISPPMLVWVKKN